MSALSPRQSEVLAFITKFLAEQGMPPTRHDIARHFGWASDNAAECHIQALRRKGAIYILDHKARGIQLAEARAQ